MAPGWEGEGAKSAGVSGEVHTVMVTMMRPSPKARIALASPSSVCSRQTNPGAESARALISSSVATNPARRAEVSGSSGRAMSI